MKTENSINNMTADNEEGFILVVCMLIMLVLTVFGTAATRNTTVELKIAGNDKIYVTDLYLAEANAYEAARRLEDEAEENLKDADLNFDDPNIAADGLVKSDEMVSYDALDDTMVEKLLTTTDLGNIAVTSPLGGAFAAVDKGIAAGGSLAVPNSSQLHSFDVYGYSSQKNSRAIIRVGYKKRF